VSADFKTMIESLLSQKPEISLEQVRELIDEKKRKIGAGYLTDQGALFLVAADARCLFGECQASRWCNQGSICRRKRCECCRSDHEYLSYAQIPSKRYQRRDQKSNIDYL